MDNMELPCKIDEVIKFNLNFDNLGKVLVFLTNSNNILSQKVRDLSIKLATVDEIQAQIEDYKFQTETHIRRHIEAEESITSHSNKFLEIESKLGDVIYRNTENDNKINECLTITKAFDENINNLNRLVEDNIKSVEKNEEIAMQLKIKSEKNAERIDRVAQDIKRDEKKFSELESKTSENNLMIKETNKKIEENDKTIVRIIQNVSEVGDNVKTLMDSKLQVTTSNNNIEYSRRSSENLLALQYESQQKMIMNEIARMNKALEMVGKENKELSKNFNEIIAKDAKEKGEMLEKLSSLGMKINNGERTSVLLRNIENFNMKFEGNEVKQFVSEISLNDDPTEKPEKSKENEINNLHEAIKTLGENMKLIVQNLGCKQSKEEVERIHKSLLAEIDRVSEKINETIKNFESKNLQGKGHTLLLPSESDMDDPAFETFLNNAINKISKNVMDNEISKIDLTTNVFFKDILLHLDAHKNDIDKIFESIVDIRKNILSNPVEDNLKELNTKHAEMEVNIRKLKILVQETIRSIEGDNESDSEDNINISTSLLKHRDKEARNSSASGSIKEFIRLLNLNVKSIGDKIEKVQGRQDNMNAEILGKVKKDLQVESSRILEEFKLDLKNKIGKIEDQLREKVDRFNLDEFGRKIDSKLNFEINKKLDRNELKKNTNQINRKIDSLENKISKTLVDTLIDLQMDEAPLIVKKSMNGEKCASCNQVLPNQHYQMPSENFPGGYIPEANSTAMSKFRGTRFNFRGKEEGVQSESVEKTEKREKRENNRKGFQLPEIGQSKSSVDIKKRGTSQPKVD